MANLASTYRDQGRWKEEEELQGPEHPDTLTSINNLAFTWKNSGRDTEAYKLMEQFVAARTRALGTNHPFTLSPSAALLEWQERT
jgi:hypothetical protein